MQRHHSPHGLGCKTVLNTCFITLILRKMENANGRLIQTHPSRKKTSKRGKTIVCDTLRLLCSNKLVFRVAGERHASKNVKGKLFITFKGHVTLLKSVRYI